MREDRGDPEIKGYDTELFSIKKCKHGTPIDDECTRCHCDDSLLLEEKN